MQDAPTVERAASRPSSGQRLEGIDGLRAIAALSIVVVHVWGFSTPGATVLGKGHPIADGLSSLSAGVTLFFTLSGFLLYRPFAAAIARGVAGPPIRRYLRNRLLRIAPAYWVILAVTALLLGAVNVRAADGTLGVGRLTDPAALLGSALLLQNYRPTTILEGVGPAWSLAVEAVFYMVLPVMVLAVAALARRASRRRTRVALLLGPPLLLLVVGLSGKAVAAHALPASPLAGYGANWHSVVERSFWAQADLFCFGMLVAVAHAEVSDGRLALGSGWRRWSMCGGLAVFLPCAASMHQAEHSYRLQNTGEALGISLLFAAIVLPGAGSGARRRALRVLEWPPLVGVGLISYSLFLWHQPMILWLTEHGVTLGGWAGLGVNLLLVSAVSLTLSAVTYRWVERPALRRKRSTREVLDAPAEAASRSARAPA